MLPDISWTEVFALLIQWDILLFISLGVLIGLTVGVIPGMTATMGLALVLPFTFRLNLYQSVALLIGIYKASMFGGSISAITFGTPGTPAAVLDVLDGFALTKKGQANKALQLSLYASLIADVGSDLVLLGIVGPLAILALAFGPREMFFLMLVAFTTVLMFVRVSPLRGFVSLLIGVFIALIGADVITGVPRFAFDIPQLVGGIDLLPFLVGLFAFSEILLKSMTVIKQQKVKEKTEIFSFNKKLGGRNLSIKELLSCYREIVIGWATGTFLGILPGPGAVLSAYTSYAFAKRFSPKRKDFGKGALEGLAAAEAGNSATCGATLIPLFALGIPGSAMAALFAGAFMMQGITPGPSILRDTPQVMYTILMLIIFANIFHLVIAKLLIPLYVSLAYLPFYIMIPFLGIFAIFGTYAYQNSPFQVLIMILAGVLGYWMKAFNFPLEPTLVGFILTPMIEANLRRSLLLARGDIRYFFQSPLAVCLFILIIIITFLLIWQEQKKNPIETISKV